MTTEYVEIDLGQYDDCKREIRQLGYRRLPESQYDRWLPEGFDFIQQARQAAGRTCPLCGARTRFEVWLSEDARSFTFDRWLVCRDKWCGHVGLYQSRES